MGFFFTSAKPADKNLKGLSQDFLRRHGCNVCPLDNVRDLHSPKMLPTGSKNPEILIIGTCPTQLEDQKGKPFVGKYSKMLHDRIPDQHKDKIRYANLLDCSSSKLDNVNVALNCCWSRTEQDIVATKPKAILGLGYLPLQQFVKPIGQHAQIGLWRGRKVPVNIGGHVCWYYPMLHPLDIIQEKNYGKRFVEGYGNDNEFAFALDLKNAFEELDSLPAPAVHALEDATAGIEHVTDLNRLATLLDAVATDPSVGVDIETNCLRPYSENAKILTIALSGKKNTFAFPVDHPQAQWTKLQRQQLDVLIKRFLYESDCRKIVHHLAFELEWFQRFWGVGCFYSGRWDCSEVQAHLLDARRGSLSLDFLCLQYFGFNLKAISGLDRKNLEKAPLQQVLKYNAIDARYHRLLFLEQAKRIKKEGLREVYEHQMRRIPALVLAQVAGVPVDQTVVKGLKKKYQKRAEQAADAIAEQSIVKKFEQKKGKQFNPSSSHDVNYLLKELLKLEVESTAKGELANIDHPIAKLIVQWREPNKVLSTYIESIDDVSEDTNLFPDGLLHPIISTTTVVTNRTSSDSPNIQNFPKHDSELKEVRTQVKSPDTDMVIVSIDYAGIQARNVAMESKDKRLVNAYWNNYDIHSDWRERILRRYPKWMTRAQREKEKDTKEFRQIAKNKFVFATFFGAQAYNTSMGLGIPREICEALREEFFDEFPGIEKWHKNLTKLYYETGYVTGLSGFRRRAPVSGTELINSPIQGDEAAIVLDAMSTLAEMEDPRYQPMLEIHDDLSFLWPKKEVEKRLEVVTKVMVNCPFEWAQIVPIEVEASCGPDWLNQTKIGAYVSDGNGGVKNAK